MNGTIHTRPNGRKVLVPDHRRVVTVDAVRHAQVDADVIYHHLDDDASMGLDPWREVWDVAHEPDEDGRYAVTIGNSGRDVLLAGGDLLFADGGAP